MGIIIAIIVGGLAGWLASKLMNRDREQGVIGNVVVGVIGAFLGNWLFSGLTNTETDLSHPTLGGFLLAIAGAVVLLALVNLFTRRSIR